MAYFVGWSTTFSRFLSASKLADIIILNEPLIILSGKVRTGCADNQGNYNISPTRCSAKELFVGIINQIFKSKLANSVATTECKVGTPFTCQGARVLPSFTMRPGSRTSKSDFTQHWWPSFSSRSVYLRGYTGSYLREPKKVPQGFASSKQTNRFRRRLQQVAWRSALLSFLSLYCITLSFTTNGWSCSSQKLLDLFQELIDPKKIGIDTRLVHTSRTSTTTHHGIWKVGYTSREAECWSLHKVKYSIWIQSNLMSHNLKTRAVCRIILTSSTYIYSISQIKVIFSQI